MGCVGFGGSSWSASNLCSFLPSLLYPQPCLAALSLELGHLGCSGREQPSDSDCCCDLGWSFRATVLQREKSVPSLPLTPHPPQQLCPPFSWCWGGHLRVGQGASPLPSAVQVTPPPAWSAAYSCSDLRATGTRWAEGLHSPGPRPPAIPFLVQPRPRQASPVIKTD